MKRNPDLTVPFNARGDLMHTVAAKDTPEWRINDEFSATLKLVGVERGRSAAFFKWHVESSTNIDLVDTFVPMFMVDMQQLLMQGRTKSGGVARGAWYVVKRGKNFGLRPADAPQPRATPVGGSGLASPGLRG